MLIKLIFCVFIDKNGIDINIPNNWQGKWNSNISAFKFKPNYLFSIGEGIVKRLTESEYNMIRLNLRNRINYTVKEYTYDKAIYKIDIYGVIVNMLFS
jgi:hypothetical protein